MADKLATKQVEHVAKLANFPITTKETSQFQKQLSEVVEYVSKIANLKTKSAKLERRQEMITRTDEIDTKQCLTQEQALSGARNVHNGLFVAPYVFSEK